MRWKIDGKRTIGSGASRHTGLRLHLDAACTLKLPMGFLAITLGIAAGLIYHAPAALAAARTIIVSPDKSQSHFQTIDSAIASIPKRSRTAVTLLIRPGIYHERIIVPRHAPPITFMGVSAADTILVDSRIAYQKGSNGKPIGTFSTQSTWIRSNNFSAANITFANDAGISGNGYDGQALAIRVDGDRSVFYHCHFVGWQDTILLNKNRQYFDRCRILGAVDFIFGNATAFFNRCHIVALGYGCLTAPRTPADHPYGFVFSHCKISSYAKAHDTWLGRPWGPFASSIFLHCRLPASLNAAVFQHWMDKRSPETARFAEFADTVGPSGTPSGQTPAWISQLTAAQAAAITIGSVLGGSDHWNPELTVQRLANHGKRLVSAAH